MTQSHSISPLRRRMCEDMTLRKLSAKTQQAYIRAVKRFTRFLGRSPDKATAEDLRCFQLHLATTGVSNITINATITGLRFFFEVTLGRRGVTSKLTSVREPRKLPVVLSPEDVARLLEAAPNLKAQAALAVAYATGLRAGEVVALKVSDIDRQRRVIHVEQGKGSKDRYAILSPALRELLRQYYRQARARGKIRPDGWLFPGMKRDQHLSTRQLNRLFHCAVDGAGLDKKVSLHSLRHAFATHLLEQHTDIRVIQVLLGHKKLETTALYSQVATKTLHEVISPLDTLPLASLSTT